MVVVAVVSLSTACAAAPDAQPLDLRDRDACALLGAEALEGLGLGVGVRDPETAGCAWRTLDDQADLTLVLSTRAGLDPDSQRIVPPVPLTVEGYPAKRVDPLDAPNCRIVVGVAATQSFAAEAAERSSGAPRLCDLARRLAAEAVRALQPSR
ncbi:hypothetical protein GCM10023175_03170 [Pseudonocardia xishanensis]|uniref:DUF3558 domain-containing protein n=1 Tax=Pseudonocardia xishanensis TaxID=630995 RepID=A0ABP8RE10_9PSEU